MRPIRLEIQGFTSFRNRASLDFNDMEVFSIVGENGAGKSSLLEAMLFALYGQTPRMQGVAKKDLVSQGSNEMKVLFEFSSGDRVYRVTRSFKIKGTPFAKIEKYEHGDWATVADKDGEVTREVERILRLPYNAFTKAVIIPQGQFDKFLKPDSPSERRNILIKMFDLEIYERMRTMASDIKGKAEQEEEKIQYRLENEYKDANPEELNDVSTRRDELGKKENTLDASLKELNAKRISVREIVELKKQMDQQGQETSNLDRELNKERKNLLETEKQVKELEGTQLGRIPLLEGERDSLLGALEKLEALGKKEITLGSTVERLKSISQNIVALEGVKASLAGTKNEAENALSKLNKELEHVGFEEDYLEKLQSVYKSSFELGEKLKEVNETEKTIREALTDIKNLEDADEKLSHELEKIEMAYRKVEGEFESVKIKGHTFELRKSIKAGDDCPVCGSSLVTVPKIPKDEAKRLEAELERVENLKSSLKAQLEEKQKEKNHVTAKSKVQNESLKKFRQQLSSKQKDIEEMSEAIGKVIKVPKGEIPNIYIEREYNNQSELRKAFQEHQKHMVEMKEKLTKIEIDLKETDGDIRVKSQERQSIEKLRDGMVDEIRDSRDRLIAYLGGTTSVKDSIAIVKTKVNTLRKEIENIQRDYLTAKEDLAKIIERVKGLEQRFNEAKKEWESMAVKLERLSDEERAYSEADLRKLEEDYETIRNELGIVQRSLGAIESKISELKKKIAEVEELRKAVSLKRNQKTLYGNLAQDLQNNRLQNYVVGRLLETLIGTCNRTLKDLTRNRYTLDLNEKENMIVRDSWNGDEQRPVETLSGGETFVIALSLALSLSEFMKGGVSLESLFLDEGFSNLDRQRLDLVSDALGNLPLYGKVVGVITHLEELAERFPVRVHVKNSPEGSSITVATI